MVYAKKYNKTKYENHRISEDKYLFDKERDALLKIIKQYKVYLCTGIFKNIPIERDIEVCQKVINSLDEFTKNLHSERIKEIYCEHAIVYKEFISTSIDNYSKKELALDVIGACDKVIENPSYENCVAFDDFKALLNPIDCIMRSNNIEQERVHVQLYNRLESVEVIVTMCKH